MEKLDLLKSHIDAYTKKDGTLVAAHDRAGNKTGGQSFGPGLSHPAYTTPVKLPKWNYAVTAHGAGDTAAGAKILRRLNPSWTKADHARLAGEHGEAAKQHRAAWEKRADQAAQRTFGRPFEFGDYRVSGIGREEFSDLDKDALRHHAHSEGKHKSLALIHAHAARFSRGG